MIKANQRVGITDGEPISSHANGAVIPISKSLCAEYQGKPFLPILEVVKETGLSSYYLRQGCRDGWIPHIRCGNKVVINMRLFLPILDSISQQGSDTE